MDGPRIFEKHQTFRDNEYRSGELGFVAPVRQKRPSWPIGTTRSFERNLGPGALDARDRVVGDGVLFAEMLEQRRQRREAMADRGAARDVFAQREVVVPGDDVRPITIRKSSGREMPVNRMKSRIALS